MPVFLSVYLCAVLFFVFAMSLFIFFLSFFFLSFFHSSLYFLSLLPLFTSSLCFLSFFSLLSLSHSHALLLSYSLGLLVSLSFALSTYIYINIFAPPPPRYPGLGLVQSCFDRGSRQEEQLRFAHWETRGRRFASLKKGALNVTHALFQWLFHTKFNSHIFPHKPCLLSKALPQITRRSSHTNHALFQRLFHRKFTHPLTQHMSFYMSSFNETKAAYVKELPRKVNPV